MSSTIPLPPRQQLCSRYCSNKHTHNGPSEEEEEEEEEEEDKMGEGAGHYFTRPPAEGCLDPCEETCLSL